MEERRIVEEEFRSQRSGRSRGPIIGLLILLTLVLVVLVLFLVSGESEDSGDDVDPGDIEVDIGDEDG